MSVRRQESLRAPARAVMWALALVVGNCDGRAGPAVEEPQGLRPPDESRVLHRPVPDVVLLREARPDLRLSELWAEKPVLLTLVFTRCAGVCSPFLRSLKAAVAKVGGAGTDFQVVVGSFDPRDHASEMAATATHLGLRDAPGWTFAALPAQDAERLAAAVGFWYRWDETVKQFDHPAMLIAIERGRVTRLLAGGAVSPVRLQEIVDQLNGKFIAAYPLPGKVAFRCFDYGPGGRLEVRWGILVLLLPSLAAAGLTLLTFGRARGRMSSGGRRSDPQIPAASFQPHSLCVPVSEQPK